MVNQQQKRNNIKQNILNSVNGARRAWDLKNYLQNREMLGFGKSPVRGTLTDTIADGASPYKSITTPALDNGSTSLAADLSSKAPTSINAVAPATTGAGVGVNALSNGANAGVNGALASGLGTSNLGTFGTAAASEALGEGGMGLASLGNIGANVATTAGGSALSGAGAGIGGAMLGALGPIGALAGLGMMIWNMIDGARKEKQMKAMQMAQQEGQKSEQEVEKTTQESMVNLQQSAQDKKNALMQEALMNMQPKEEEQQPQGVQGDLASSVNNPALKQMALNNQTGQPVQPQTIPTANTTGAAADIPVEQSNNGALTQSILGEVMNNVPTSIGASTPTPNPTTTQTPAPTQTVPQQNVIDQQFVEPQQLQQGMVQDTQDNRTLGQKFTDFFDETSRGFNENNSTRFNPRNLGEKTYNTTETIVQPHDDSVGAYADKLKSKGVKEDVINAFLQEGKDSRNKEIADWVNQHQDLRNPDGSWKPVEKTVATSNKKGLGYRMGEAMGTAHRVLSNPAVQAGLAGIGYGIDKNDALYGLRKGIEWGTDKARSDAYRRMVTGDDSASVFGGYSEKDLNALTNQQYRDALARAAGIRANNDTTRVNGQVTHWKNQDNINQQKANTDKTYKEGMLGVNKQNANSRATTSNAYAQKVANDIKTKSIKPEQHPSFANDLSQFRQVYSQAKDDATRDKYINKFISVYGVDPRKYLKDNSEV